MGVNKKLLFVLTMLFTVYISGPIYAGSKTWDFQWQFDRMTDQSSCYMYSSTEHFNSQVGDIFYSDFVYLAVQDSGKISIILRNEIFNPLLKGKIGIRIDNNPPVFGVEIDTHGRIATFNKEKSAILLGQMQKGEKALVQLEFFPSSDLIQKEYVLATSKPLSYFTLVLSEWKGCQYNKQNKHWSGLLLLKSPCNQQCQNELKEKYDGEIQESTTVWSANPHKPGGKAGLKGGDGIVAVNGSLVSYDNLIKLLDNMNSGDKIEINIYRFDGDEYFTYTLIRP
ncbi:MAG: hypothetical protein ABFR65_00940 [Pseudomonadota bacterium]